MVKQRSLLIFESGIKSESTRKNYLDHLRLFLEFSKIKDYDSLTRLPAKNLQEMTEDYVMYLKKRVSPNSVPVYMTGIKHFFIMNHVGIFWDMIQKLYPAKVKKSGQKPWTSEQISKMVEYNTSKRNKAIIHLLASTGARIGIFNYPLEMQNLKNMGNDCKAILIYAGEIDEYWAFLTPEATQALDDYFEVRREDGERFYPNSPIIRKRYSLGIEKAFPVGRNAVISMIFRSINKAGIKRLRVNRNFDTQMDHGFRKRFNTILKINNDVNSNITEKLMAHKNGLDGTYFQPTIEECFVEFKKAIPELTITSTERQKVEINNKNKKIETLEAKNHDLEMQKDEIERLTHAVNYLMKKKEAEQIEV